MPELLSNTCRRCRRRLHSLASRRRGLGPVCAALEAGAPWLLPEVADAWRWRLRVYISGPMKNIPDLNREAFSDAERALIALGYETVNPHHLSPERGEGETDADYYERCMAADLAALEKCQAIAMLPRWQISSGAKRELKRAFELGLDVLELPQGGES